MAKTTEFQFQGTNFAWSQKANWTNGVPVDGDTVIVNGGAAIDDIPSLDLAVLNLNPLASTVNPSPIVENGTLTIESLIGNSQSQLWVAPLVGGIPHTAPSEAIINGITATSTGGLQFHIMAFGQATVVNNATTDPGITYNIGNGATVVSTGGGVSSASQFDFVSYSPVSGISHSGTGSPATIIFADPSSGTQASLFEFGPGDTLELPGTSATAQFNGVSTSEGESGTLTVTTNLGTYSFRSLLASGISSLGYTTHYNSSTGLEAIDFNCFARGTRLDTLHGPVAIESLSAGDLVATRQDSGTCYKPVKWIGRRLVDLAAHPRPDTVAPVRIETGAFAENEPRRDLLLSPDHAVFVDGKLICARQLVNGTTIRHERGLRQVEYLHVELEEHSIVLAEGLPVESYLDTGNRSFFTNASTSVMLYPRLYDETDHVTREEGSCAPFVWDEANVKPVWDGLVARAASRGRPVLTRRSTTNPDLHLVVHSGKLRPVTAVNNSYRFILPTGLEAVRLVSRAALPTDTRPWLEDRRRLGVLVSSITLHSACGRARQEIPMDHPGLTQGWWQVERDGIKLLRWTNGDATVPLFGADMEMRIIDIDAGGMVYPTLSEQCRDVA